MKYQTIIDFAALVVFLIIFFGFHFLFLKLHTKEMKDAKEGIRKLNEADKKRWAEYDAKKTKPNQL